jgi:hypothetical protein
MPDVMVSQHPPARCPTSTAKTRERVQPRMTPVAAAQKQPKVRWRSGPIWGVSPRRVVRAEAPHVKAVRAVARETGLGPWSRVERSSAWGVDEGIPQASARTPIHGSQRRLVQPFCSG